MTMNLYVGYKYDSHTRTGAWVCFPENPKSSKPRSGVVENVSAADLELISVIEGLKYSEAEPYTLFTSSNLFYVGISGQRDERHEEYWDQIESISDERIGKDKPAVKVQFVKHPDNKRGTRYATKQADELLQEHLDCAEADGEQASDKPKAEPVQERPPVKQETSGMMGIKAPAPIEATPICDTPGRVPVMKSLLSDEALERLEGADRGKPHGDEDGGNDLEASKGEASDDELCHLVVHKDQLPVIQNALEMYARLGMGQLNELTMALSEKHIPFGTKIRKNQVKAKIREFDSKQTEAEKVLGLTDRSGVSIFDDDVTPSAKVAWDMYQSLLDPETAEDHEFAGAVNHRLHIEK